MSIESPCQQISNLRHTSQQGSPRKGASSRLRCVLCRNELHGAELLIRLPSLAHSRLYPMPRLYGFLKELHSFAHRIAATWSLRHRIYFLFVGPFQQGEAEHHQPNIRTRACTDHIKNFVLVHPWATILDLQIYRDAWQAGVEWHVGNAYKQEHGKADDLTCQNPAL